MGLLVCPYLFYYTDSNSSARMPLHVCVKALLWSQTQLTDSRLGFKSVSFLVSPRPHALLHACLCILSTSKWTCASVSVYTSACCYWVSLAGSLLALDQHPKATCRCFEASGQQAPHLRSMEARGSKWKPQTLTNTWAGVTFTGLFTKT